MKPFKIQTRFKILFIPEIGIQNPFRFWCWGKKENCSPSSLLPCQKVTPCLSQGSDGFSNFKVDEFLCTLEIFGKSNWWGPLAVTKRCFNATLLHHINRFVFASRLAWTLASPTLDSLWHPVWAFPSIGWTFAVTNNKFLPYPISIPSYILPSRNVTRTCFGKTVITFAYELGLRYFFKIGLNTLLPGDGLEW
jgi:hypothetical protein